LENMASQKPHGLPKKGKGHERALSKEDVKKILDQAEVEMKKRRRIKLERQKSIKRVSMDLQNVLKKKLENRLDRKELARRHILKERTQTKNLFATLGGKKGGLEKFLKARPTRSKLMSLNIISEGKQGVCAAEKVDLDAKRKIKRKENLALLIGKRPSMEQLRSKKILIDLDVIDKEATKKKLKSFLKLRPAAERVSRFTRNRRDARRKSIAEAKSVLGGFLQKRLGATELQKKNILKDVTHIHVPNTNLGDHLSFQAIKLAVKVKAVACGFSHSLIVAQDGKAYTCGMGQDGRLGLGDGKDVATPTIIKTLADAGKVSAAACGDNHSVAVMEDGAVYTWGMGSGGRLGHQSTESLSTPKKLPELKGSCCAAGGYHTLVGTTDGAVFGFGYNRKGQVGVLSIDGTVMKPTQISKLKNVVDVYCGTTSSGALTKEGALYVWGSGRGLSHGNQPVAEPMALRFKGAVKKVAFGATHFLALTDSGLFSWGSNTFGELGRETKGTNAVIPTAVESSGIDASKIKALSCGRNYSAVLTADGKLQMSGRGTKGVLGLGKASNQPVFTAVDNEFKVSEISCGYMHTLAVTEGGVLIGCGNKDHGKLGVGKF